MKTKRLWNNRMVIGKIPCLSQKMYHRIKKKVYLWSSISMSIFQIEVISCQSKTEVCNISNLRDIEAVILVRQREQH